ncbi:MAG: protein kinase domain-containing protein [Nannocystales bacterium]
MDETPHEQEAPGASIVWEAGTLMGRRYVLERLLGRGANGHVWLARDQLLNKSVALKALDPQLAKNRDTVRRFLREVALAHAVTHPHVVRIYDTGEEGGLPFFTMEYIQGQTLQERLDGDEGPLDFKALRRTALAVLDGLESAHQVGVIHRDLKPGNVMLTHRGAIVMDFGVAGIEEAPQGDPSASSVHALVRTEAGTIFGSPAYMAPELWEGQGASVRSDLFAFGVMLYQMVTGRLPWSAKTPAGYLQALASTRPPPIRALRRDTPWPLLRLCMRCLSHSPAERPPSAAAAIDLLSPLRSTRRRRLALIGAGAIGLAGAAALWRTPWAERSRGLPDPQTRMDLDAAVRMFDAGDDAAALRVMDRLATRAPRSAALVFWRATVLHALGDAPGRAAACGIEGHLDGNRTWRRRAELACAERFELDIQGPKDAGEFLPLWADNTLVPTLYEANASSRERALEALALLEPDENDDTPGRLQHRRQRARVDLALSLGRLDEAQQHLAARVDAQPHVPLYARHLAWLASRRGQHDRALVLARRVQALDPTASLALEMDAGRMRSAWTRIEALGESHPHAAGLRDLWCGLAWKFGVAQPPAACTDLPPGFARALWSDSPTGLARIATDPCPDLETPATVLTVAPWGFETTPTEAMLRGALCRADAGESEALGHAREHVSRLLSATPDDPWVSILAADVSQRSGDAPSANAYRVAAAQRWRDADADLPVVATLRRTLDGAPAGPRAAEMAAPSPPGDP